MMAKAPNSRRLPRTSARVPREIGEDPVDSSGQAVQLFSIEPDPNGVEQLLGRRRVVNTSTRTQRMSPAMKVRLEMS